MAIEHNVREILNELPDGVELVAVAKAQRPEAVLKAVAAGGRRSRPSSGASSR